MTARREVLPPALAVQLRHRFPAPRATVFRAWTDPEVLRRWWCPPGWAPTEIEVDLRAGGAYRIGMRKVLGGPPIYVLGHFLEVDRAARLVYTWRWQNAFEGMPETRVTVLFTDAPTGGTDVVLVHEKLPGVPLCLRHWNGWNAAWLRVDAALAVPVRSLCKPPSTKGPNRWGQ